MFQDWFIIFLKRKKKKKTEIPIQQAMFRRTKFKPSLLVLPVLKTEANLVIIQQFQLKFRFGF